MSHSSRDDLEMTKLCAVAIGLEVELVTHRGRGGRTPYYRFDGTDSHRKIYDPLHNDAQAMALVKKFRLNIFPPATLPNWQIWIDTSHDAGIENPDLNRAIVECVAKMSRSSQRRNSWITAK
jgi:hypothetical protein